MKIYISAFSLIFRIVKKKNIALDMLSDYLEWVHYISQSCIWGPGLDWNIGEKCSFVKYFQRTKEPIKFDTAWNG